MFDTTTLIRNYSQVVQVIESYGFSNPILFKGFCKDEEANLNIYLEDNPDLKDVSIRKLKLSDALCKLLKCNESNVVLTTKERMDPYYFSKLNETNSVKLGESVPTEKLNQIFSTSVNQSASPSTSVASGSVATMMWSKPESKTSSSASSGNLESNPNISRKLAGVKMELIQVIKDLGKQVDLDGLFEQLKCDVSKELDRREQQQSTPVVSVGGGLNRTASQ